MNWREDRTLLTLSFFTIFFTAVVLVCVFIRPNDGQLYQTFATLMAGFAGALSLHMTGAKAPPAGSTTIVSTEQVTKIPQEEK